ncbi:BTB/POZ domain-containing protein At4g08455-like [Mangifera indica]|uniref:BTB/POZ domain-containing protein At4g08455-like n=1 Tax=Mangifera indica TaxID=29780 RepID=UPI001CFBDBE8|nr:BTB/POZ domain-containing protein At4g08455-like [Mangifera indica]
MYCSSCRNYPDDGGLCNDCYVKTGEIVEELLREIEGLKAKIAFLRFSSPLDHRNHPYYTDIVLHAASEDKPSVPAHKAVLVNRSPVFKAMLENEMAEKRSGTIKISDVSHDVLCEFVNYIYTAEVCLDEQMACELLELAEKYDIKHLKAYCEKFLVSKLNWENSIMNYVFAHQLNAKHLLRAALSLITDNMSDFTKREEYMELVENNPRLLVEIYEVYLCKQDSAAAQNPFHSESP